MLRESPLLALLSTASAAALPADNIERSNAGANSNFSTYAPVRIQCPATSQWVRPATELSREESDWVAGRKKKALTGLSSYLKRLHLVDFDTDGYLKRLGEDTSRVPTIGMALSGGGWAPALTSTGPLLAFDDRFEASRKERTGGILQSMTYLSGLSGGSWPVMSLATYNFPTIADMIGHWHVDQSALDSQKNTKFRVTPANLFKEIVPKFEAGFNVSIADLLGRGFATEFVDGPNGGISTMVSDIASLSNFKDHEMPFPMWQAPQGTPDDIKFFGLAVPYFNATIFEWNPLEFGAWGGPASFFPTQYLGTKMADGKPINNDCIVGFDRASFMLGCAADATNFWQIEAWSNGTLGHFSKKRSFVEAHAKRDDLGELEDSENVSFSQEMLSALEEPFKEHLNYTLVEMMYATLPNPFASSSSFNDESNPPENLTLIDSSEGGQALPLWSQVQPARNPEFVMTWDDDEDALPYRWNNGTNLYNSYIYASNANIPFPIIPPATTFVNRGLIGKPVFFGCDANLTNTKDTRAPIILSMTNGPYSAYTNYTWTKNEFSHEQMAVITTNGFNQLTAGNSTLDAEWPECLGCAAIDRSLSKLGIQRTEQCQRCMTKYCWDGVEDNSKPGLVDLPLVLDPSMSYAEWNASTTADFWPEIKKMKGAN